MTPRPAGLLLAAAVAAAAGSTIVRPVHAADYTPAQCVSAQTYEGAPLRAAPLPPGPPAKGLYHGRGVMVYDVPDTTGHSRVWLGHSGGTPGAKAVVAWSPTDSAFVAVALTGDGSSEATALLLLKQLGEAPAPPTKP